LAQHCSENSRSHHCTQADTRARITQTLAEALGAVGITKPLTGDVLIHLGVEGATEVLVIASRAELQGLAQYNVATLVRILAHGIGPALNAAL